jgi:hypothetical protein
MDANPFVLVYTQHNRMLHATNFCCSCDLLAVHHTSNAGFACGEEGDKQSTRNSPDHNANDEWWNSAHLLLEGEQFPGSLPDLGKAQLDPPHLEYAATGEAYSECEVSVRKAKLETKTRYEKQKLRFSFTCIASFCERGADFHSRAPPATFIE